ncbi:hypothetical protein LINPERPRIM_LOCUS11227, partial [Linum perenne]
MSLCDGKKVIMPWGPLGPTTAGPAALLGQFTGLLGNDQNLLPLQYEEWPNVTDGEKNDLKTIVFPPEMTDLATKYIMEDIGRKWRDCKIR